MSYAIDPTLRELNDCGCCAGTERETPAPIENRPGLPAIVRRVGGHGTFKRSMLAGLSQPGRTALQALKTRTDDDFSIALLDAWAMVADVLTFYQERIANENYLPTATERRSVIELSRLVGYELGPGVAASTRLAFQVEGAAGAPGVAQIDARTKVMSVPGPGEKPQTFETVEAIVARAAWNALRPRQTQPRPPARGDTWVYIRGTAPNLRAGDMILIVGSEREQDAASDHWELRRLSQVTADGAAGRTLLQWAEPLERIDSTGEPRVYALRLRASIFGHNAPEWKLLPASLRASYLGVSEADLPGVDTGEWPEFTIYSPRFPIPRIERSIERIEIGTLSDRAANTIDLDTVYSDVLSGGWIVFSVPDDQELFRIQAVTEAARAEYALQGKTTRLVLQGENWDPFENAVRETTVFTAGEELEVAEAPILEPLYGTEVVLDNRVSDLRAGQSMIVTGRRARLRLREEHDSISPTEELIILAPPLPQGGGRQWWVQRPSGSEAALTLADDQLTFVPARGDDVLIAEVVVLQFTPNPGELLTRLPLRDPLENAYDRTTVMLCANTALATHGETVNEVLGSGDGSRAYQRFTLRQPPLTYVSAPTTDGRASTLEVRVNGVLWHEARGFFGHGPRERIYTTRGDDSGRTTVRFGDGQTGVRLPTGQENVTATYRKGIGREGQVGAGQLTSLITRPLGVKGVTNPIAATGAEDPERLEDARRNAPTTVLTLGRIVSLDDYADFARAFAGIAKAHVAPTWEQNTRGVILTIAGDGGDAVTEGSALYENLLRAVRAAGDPSVPVHVVSYRAPRFTLAATVRVDPDYDAESVVADVRSRLQSAFSFEAREFGQPVALSEVLRVMQEAPGAVSVDLDALYRTDEDPALQPLLLARTPDPGTPPGDPAELLTLDPAALDAVEAAP